MRLLIVSDYAWPTGGTEQFVSALLERASAMADCRLLTWEGPVSLPPGFDAVTRVSNGDMRGAWECLRWAEVTLVVTSFNVRLLARLAQEQLALASTPAITVVQTSGHSDRDSASVAVQERWLRDLMAVSHATVAVSDAVAAALARLRDPDEAPPRVVVIENGARLRAPAAARAERRARVSFIGRPCEQKGYPLFVRLARELSDDGLAFAANTVSIAPAEPAPCIAYSRLLDDDALLAFFAETDLLVAPYLHADGLPLALLEALNCGVPVLGFDAPPVGALLRRHGQPVVAPTYAALRDAVVAWQAGKLTVAAPPPGRVPSWDEQFTSYASLLRSVADEPYASRT